MWVPFTCRLRAAKAAVEYKQAHPEEYVLFDHGGSPVAVELFGSPRLLMSASLDQHNAQIALKEGRDPLSVCVRSWPPTAQQVLMVSSLLQDTMNVSTFDKMDIFTHDRSD